MADVFISYHEKSAGELAAQIAAALESAGISCWYAKRDIPPGGDFARYIPPQIDACKVFLLILNDSVVHQSNHIENELGLAFSRLNKGENITIVPFEIGNFKRESWVKYYLVHTQGVKIPSLDVCYNTLALWSLLIQNQNVFRASDGIIKRGQCGDNVMYTLDTEGALAIFGNGSMWNWTSENVVPWNEERPKIQSIRIENGVTGIGNSAFHICPNLTNVTIADSVTYIGDLAFFGCQNLTSIYIPDSVLYIGCSSFYLCTQLRNASVSNHAIIGKDAFPYIQGTLFPITNLIRRA